MVENLYLTLIDIMDKVFLAAGIAFLFLGFAGIIIVLTSYDVGFFKDEVISFSFGFVNTFMALLGIFLILFHNKIIVRPKQYQ